MTQDLVLQGAFGSLAARPSGALWAPERRRLLVADLHLGKSERLARRGGPFLPPYDTAETLRRLEAEMAATEPREVLLLGDSFDDSASASRLTAEDAARLDRLRAEADWIFIAGNHDPAPALAGATVERGRAEDGMILRHIAEPAAPPPGVVEISGHFHPKATLCARGRRLTRRCFLWDGRRLILPAFGAYTGGLDATDAVFDRLLGPDAAALLCSGDAVRAAPRRALARRAA